MKKSLIIIITSVLIVFSGCGYFRMATKNIGRNLTQSPEIVWNKISSPVKDNVRLTALWGGHSTMLVQMYDKVILFDPLFNNYLFGIQLRRKETGLDYENLKQLDLIAVTHPHMDHLSFSSLDKLSKKFPGTPFIFPEGAEQFLPNFDLDMIRADLTDIYKGKYIATSFYVNGLKITPVYALHNGGRYGLDTYLWFVQGYCGYVVEYKDVCIYFAGDTGYDEKAFKEIGKKFKITLAFIPIGPCRNCEKKGFWFHTTSLEAVELFKDLNAKYMIPIHYGSLQYMSDSNGPMQTLKEIINNPGKYFPEEDSTVLKDDFIDKIKILKEGEQIIFDELL